MVYSLSMYEYNCISSCNQVKNQATIGDIRAEKIGILMVATLLL
jgi:hypothetical protein